MKSIEVITPILFILITFFCIGWIYKASNKSIKILGLTLFITITQALLAWSGFYEQTNSTPPRPILILLPNLAIFIYLLGSPSGRKWLDTIETKHLLPIHVVRIPVEIGLYLLFIQKMVPKEMTFEGLNFDILSGISALGIIIFGAKKQSSSIGKPMVIWNIICLFLVLTIVSIAVLSLPTPFQQFGLNQPNIAVSQFPFIWLPTVIVPLVILSHVVAIKRYFNN
jgi:hypothetical protein